jgi:hypothetical protein
MRICRVKMVATLPNVVRRLADFGIPKPENYANFANRHNYPCDLPARCLELPHLSRVKISGHHVDTLSVFCAC